MACKLSEAKFFLLFYLFKENARTKLKIFLLKWKSCNDYQNLFEKSELDIIALGPKIMPEKGVYHFRVDITTAKNSLSKSDLDLYPET